jgi:hypothetical protein
MKRLYILCEGQTEEEFVNKILIPYFVDNEIYGAKGFCIKTSPGHKGGSVNYARLKRNVEKHLKGEKDVIVTTLIDFYKLSTDFPKYKEATEKYSTDKIQRVSYLENEVYQDINNDRFIPYIQLHEFEALLFSSNRGYEHLPNISNNSKKEIHKIIEQYENPELIDDKLPPSKRLIDLFPEYNKVVHGIFLAEHISLNIIMSKCSRFNEWLNKIMMTIKK